MGMLVTSGSDGLVLLMVKDRMPCCTEARIAETSASSGSDHERLKLPKRRSRCRDFWNSSPVSCEFGDVISVHDAGYQSQQGKASRLLFAHQSTGQNSTAAAVRSARAYLAVSLTVRGANIHNTVLIV